MTTAVAPDEIAIEVRIPKDGGSSAYDKLGRRGGHTDYAVAGAAAWVKRSNGSISDCRVALTGVGAKTTLAAATAQALIGTDGSAQAVAEAAAKAADGSDGSRGSLRDRRVQDPPRHGVCQAGSDEGSGRLAAARSHRQTPVASPKIPRVA